MDDGSCDTDTIASNASAMLVFTAPGTYTYHCKVHPGQMKDVTVVVQ
jgi:plastocyanin